MEVSCLSREIHVFPAPARCANSATEWAGGSGMARSAVSTSSFAQASYRKSLRKSAISMQLLAMFSHPHITHYTSSMSVASTCWSCGIPLDNSPLLCPNCGKVQLSAGIDYYQAFTLQRSFAVDTAALEREFHRLSRRLHPDRFARATPQEQKWSLAAIALLNDAYRTLRDPIQRTEYLLKLEGFEIGEEFAGKNKTAERRQPPADLLEEVFELNMQLEEMRVNQKMGENDPALQ